MEKRQKTIDVWVTDDGVEHLTKHAAEMHQEKQAEAKELSVQQLRNAETLLEHAMAAGRAAERFRQHPEELERFQQQLHDQHMLFMHRSVQRGWWADVKPNGDPIPNPKIVKISELEEHDTLMAHIVHKRLGLFESISEAKKNGWGKPIVVGDFWLNKKTIHLKVVP